MKFCANRRRETVNITNSTPNREYNLGFYEDLIDRFKTYEFSVHKQRDGIKFYNVFGVVKLVNYVLCQIITNFPAVKSDIIHVQVCLKSQLLCDGEAAAANFNRNGDEALLRY